MDEWRGELAFAYDGCTVSFRHGQGDPMRYFQTPEGLRSLDTRQYAEPAGYYRARAVWDGDRLFANSVVIDRLLVGRWRADHFVVGHRPDWRMRRVTSLSSVPERVALHLFPRPVAPSRSEWLREHGWPDETPGGL